MYWIRAVAKNKNCFGYFISGKVHLVLWFIIERIITITKLLFFCFFFCFQTCTIAIPQYSLNYFLAPCIIMCHYTFWYHHCTLPEYFFVWLITFFFQISSSDFRKITYFTFHRLNEIDYSFKAIVSGTPAVLSRYIKAKNLLLITWCL